MKKSQPPKAVNDLTSEEAFEKWVAGYDIQPDDPYFVVFDPDADFLDDELTDE